MDDGLQQELESAAEQIVAEFQQGMQEVMDNLEKAQMAFDDLSGVCLCVGGCRVVGRGFARRCGMWCGCGCGCGCVNTWGKVYRRQQLRQARRGRDGRVYVSGGGGRRGRGL